MKDSFDSYETQGRYILRILERNTDIKKVCQFCGKPAKLKNNKNNPYEIQLVCDNCRKNNSINVETGMYNIPTINIKEHLNTPFMLNKTITLTKEYIDKFNNILEGNYTKQEAIKYLNVTLSVYNKLVKEYKDKYDNNIEVKLKESYSKARSYVAMETKVQDGTNNLAKIKLERKMTNTDIYNKVGVTNRTISNISNGLAIPKNITVTLIATALDCSVQDMLPSYTEFHDVYNLDDLKLLMIKIYNEIYYIWQGSNESKFSIFLKRLSEEGNINIENLRNFVLSTKYSISDINLNLLTNNNIKYINNIFSKYNNVEFSIDKGTEFKKWKDKSKLRKRYMKSDL